MKKEEIERSDEKSDAIPVIENSCCAPNGASISMGNPNTLKIEWQRLLSNEETCPRCGSTEDELDKAVTVLKQSMAPLGIEVILDKKVLSISEFEQAPLESNRIWINDRPLEKYIEGSVGHSQCCDVCGPNDCRTVTVGGEVYEAIPSELIIKAGLIAAADMVGARSSRSCCSS